MYKLHFCATTETPLRKPKSKHPTRRGRTPFSAALSDLQFRPFAHTAGNTPRGGEILSERRSCACAVCNRITKHTRRRLRRWPTQLFLAMCCCCGECLPCRRSGISSFVSFRASSKSIRRFVAARQSASGRRPERTRFPLALWIENTRLVCVVEVRIRGSRKKVLPRVFIT